MKLNALKRKAYERKGIYTECFWCFRKISGHVGLPSKTGLCSYCSGTLRKNNLKSMIDIYLKRKQHENLIQGRGVKKK